MSNILQSLQESLLAKTTINTIINKCLRGGIRHIKGLNGSCEHLFVERLFRDAEETLLVLMPDDEAAEEFAEVLDDLFLDNTVYYFPTVSAGSQQTSYLNPREAGQQMTVLRKLASGSPALIVTTPAGLLSGLPDARSMKTACLELKKGESFPFSILVAQLVDYGYSRETLVERPGEISVRGGILDIFPYTGERPHRFEFWGDEIESVRVFDVESQMSIEKGNSLTLMPVPSVWEKADASLMDHLSTPIVYQKDPELFFPVRDLKDTDIVETEAAKAAFASSIAETRVISHHTLTTPKEAHDVGSRSVPKPGPGLKDIQTLLARFSKERTRVYLTCDSEKQTNRLSELLELDTHPILNLLIGEAPLRTGFDLPDQGLIVFTEHDLFRRTTRRRRRLRFSEGAPLRELTELKVGDFMVHIDYGIGRYAGLKTIKVNESVRECVHLTYQDGDNLYVPVDKMERIQKYAGRDGVEPALTKLGTQRWEKIKSRTKQSVKDIAKDLIAVYSARETQPGFVFQPDTAWERQLETSFEFQDTVDQSRAAREIKADMQSSKPMDRLLCGDVGYGKTEVAIRAAFKAVTGGKQVAILVPTTILAQQHYYTFSDRLSEFPVNVEMLSRFRTKKQQEKIIRQMSSGEVDVVIGTHRLLSKDVAFKDLGLLIIDEEHRFGVRHKDKIKAIRTSVDALALSATPIPRTLQLSLVNIRDMSLINTPPRDRMPIHTEVLPFDESIVAEAIHRELARGGQIFFVHNRVKTIYAVAEMLRRIVPGLRVCVGHGQMNEHELERVMVDFVEGKYDCLVATMIIESGLDMPHVNTLLVNRADRMGLAQLYQLRGRVGRSDVRAYAYLFTPPLDILSPDAIKRLRTIEEFTELGSGFQIAMRDLEIRGAGNLLGTAQSGFMDAVGFELYTRLVREAVDEIKAETGERPIDQAAIETECVVDLSAPAFIPQEYVDDENLRVNLYRRLAGLRSLPEVDALGAELQDRFGAVPEETATLLEVARLRILGQKQGVKRLMIDQTSLRLFFDEAWMDAFSSQELFSAHLRSIIALSEYPLQFLEKKGFGLRVQIEKADPIGCTKKLLQSWG